MSQSLSNSPRMLIKGIRLSSMLAAWIVCGSSAVEAQTPDVGLDRVSVVTVAKKPLKLTTTQPGRILAFEATPIATKLSGYVEAVLVDIGDRVAADHVMIRLSMPELADEVNRYEALVGQAQAEISQARSALLASDAAADSAQAKADEVAAGKAKANAELDYAQAEFQRIEQLARSGSVTSKLLDESRNKLQAAKAIGQEVDSMIVSAAAQKRQADAHTEKARADVQAAEAKLRVAEANLQHAKTMLAYREIKAPYQGVIVNRAVDTGHYVQPSSNPDAALLLLAQTDKVRLRIEVPEIEAAMIDAGENGDEVSAVVQSLNRPPVVAKIMRSSWALDASNRSLRVESDIPNLDQALRPGMYVSATITLDQRTDCIAIPITAVYKKEAGPICCVVKDGKVEIRPIELGLKSGSEIEVRQGLAVGETIVAIRGENLTAGQAVSVVVPK
jgi:HlyD family secretion protein